MKDVGPTLTLVPSNGPRSVYRYRHLFIRGVGDASDPDRFQVLKTDRETVMHESSMKGCKRFITNRKKKLDALCAEHAITISL